MEKIGHAVEEGAGACYFYRHTPPYIQYFMGGPTQHDYLLTKDRLKEEACTSPHHRTKAKTQKAKTSHDPPPPPLPPPLPIHQAP